MHYSGPHGADEVNAFMSYAKNSKERDNQIADIRIRGNHMIRPKKKFLFSVTFLSKLLISGKKFLTRKTGNERNFFSKLSIMLYYSSLLALYINLYQYF